MKSGLSGFVCAAIMIGDNTISVVIGRKEESQKYVLLAEERVIAHGVEKGAIVHIPLALQALKKVLTQAEHKAGVTIDRAVIGIQGAFITCQPVNASLLLGQWPTTFKDTQRVLQQVVEKYHSTEKHILHIIAHSFAVGDQTYSAPPIGLYGSCLSLSGLVIESATTPLRAVFKLCKLAHITIQDIVYAPLALAHITFSQAEQELGAVLMEMHDEHSVGVIVKGEKLHHVFQLSVGISHFIKDVAIAFGVNKEDALQMIMQYSNGTLLKKNKEQYHFISHVLGARTEEYVSLMIEGINKVVSLETVVAGIKVVAPHWLIPLITQTLSDRGIKKVEKAELRLRSLPLGESSVPQLPVQEGALYELLVQAGNVTNSIQEKDEDVTAATTLLHRVKALLHDVM